MEARRLVAFGVMLPTLTALFSATCFTSQYFALRVLGPFVGIKLVISLYNFANISKVLRRISLICFASVKTLLYFTSEYGWLPEDEYGIIMIKLILTYAVTYLYWQCFPQQMLMSLQYA